MLLTMNWVEDIASEKLYIGIWLALYVRYKFFMGGDVAQTGRKTKLILHNGNAANWTNLEIMINPHHDRTYTL